MEFVLKAPSLQHMAMVKIITEMWSQDDFKARIVELDRLFPVNEYYQNEDKWKKWGEIEDCVVEQMSALQIPETLKDQLRSIIKPIGLEILNWWYFHTKNKNLVLVMSSQFVWTCYGTVDYKKTAEGMVNDENLDLETRYRLACIYCLEDEVCALWKLFPLQQKSALLGKIKLETANTFAQNGVFVTFWTVHAVLGKIDDLLEFISRKRLDELFQKISRRGLDDCNFDEFAFTCAAKCGPLAAIEFFLDKLRSEGISSNKFHLVEHVQYLLNKKYHFPYVNTGVMTGVIYFLLNQMSEEQQIQLFVLDFHNVLECLLYWPWQGLFLKTVRRFWHLIDKEMYGQLLGFLVEKICYGFKDYDYRELFREIWNMGSPALKDPQFSEHTVVPFLSRLFRDEEMELMELILNETSSVQMEDFIFSTDGRFEFRTLIDRENFNLIEYLMDRGFISEETVANCKSKILLNYQDFDEEWKVKCDKILSLADELFKDKKCL